MALFSSKHTEPLDTVAVKQTGIPSNQINMIGEGTLLEGTIRTEGDVRVSGRVVGKITVIGKVIIAQEGIIEGELNATSVDVAGRVQGNLKVDERLLIRSTGVVEGDVVTARLVIEEGAVFDGSCQMVSSEVSSSLFSSEGKNGSAKQVDLSTEIGENSTGEK